MDSSEEKFEKERRRAPRVSGAVVEYSIDGQEPEKKKAFIKDICIYGICIYISEPVEEGAILCLDVFLFGSDIPLHAKGKVVWKKPGDYFGSHNVGVEFTEISEEDEQKLKDHIAMNYEGDGESQEGESA